jgi:hypothetical protein
MATKKHLQPGTREAAAHMNYLRSLRGIKAKPEPEEESKHEEQKYGFDHFTHGKQAQ